jgi:hypothetical protein
MLLPAESTGWTEQEARIVLLHELAHVKRWDCLTLLVAGLACSLHWFNPLSWIALRRMAIESERACDDLVLASGVPPADYAEQLLAIATGIDRGRLTALAAGAVAMARPQGLESRLRAILSDRVNRRSLTLGAGLLLLLAFGSVLLPVAMMKAVADDQRVTAGNAGTAIEDTRSNLNDVDEPLHVSANDSTTKAAAARESGVGETKQPAEPVWGDKVNGLQLGVSLSGHQRRLHNGMRIPYKVHVRNTSSNKTRFQCSFSKLGFRLVPTILKPNGEFVQANIVIRRGGHRTFVHTLKPNETVALFRPGSLGLGEIPDGQNRFSWSPYIAEPTPGRYQLSQSIPSFRFVDATDAPFGDPFKLTTGSIEIQIASAGSTATTDEDRIKLYEESFRAQAKVAELVTKGLLVSSPDAKLYAYVESKADDAWEIRLCDARTGEVMRRIEVKQKIKSLKFTKQGVISVNEDASEQLRFDLGNEEIKVWDAATGKLIAGITVWQNVTRITYDEHVQPLLRAKCFSCHNSDKKSGDLDLTSYVEMMKGGRTAKVIEPGNADASRLYRLVTHQSKPHMPHKGAKVPVEMIATIREWIEGGAIESRSGNKPLDRDRKTLREWIEGGQFKSLGNWPNNKELIEIVDQTGFGAALKAVNDTLRAQLNVPAHDGAVIVSVRKRSFADQAGLQENDLLLEVKPLESKDAAEKVAELFLGAKHVSATVIRSGKRTSVKLLIPLKSSEHYGLNAFFSKPPVRVRAEDTNNDGLSDLVIELDPAVQDAVRETDVDGDGDVDVIIAPASDDGAAAAREKKKHVHVASRRTEPDPSQNDYFWYCLTCAICLLPFSRDARPRIKELLWYVLLGGVIAVVIRGRIGLDTLPVYALAGALSGGLFARSRGLFGVWIAGAFGAVTVFYCTILASFAYLLAARLATFSVLEFDRLQHAFIVPLVIGCLPGIVASVVRLCRAARLRARQARGLAPVSKQLWLRARRLLDIGCVNYILICMCRRAFPLCFVIPFLATWWHGFWDPQPTYLEMYALLSPMIAAIVLILSAVEWWLLRAVHFQEPPTLVFARTRDRLVHGVKCSFTDRTAILRHGWR